MGSGCRFQDVVQGRGLGLCQLEGAKANTSARDWPGAENWASVGRAELGTEHLVSGHGGQTLKCQEHLAGGPGYPMWCSVLRGGRFSWTKLLSGSCGALAVARPGFMARNRDPGQEQVPDLTLVCSQGRNSELVLSLQEWVQGPPHSDGVHCSGLKQQETAQALQLVCPKPGWNKKGLGRPVSLGVSEAEACAPPTAIGSTSMLLPFSPFSRLSEMSLHANP